MPRPKRARGASASSAKRTTPNRKRNPANETGDPPRSRPRTTRSTASRSSMAGDEIRHSTRRQRGAGSKAVPLEEEEASTASKPVAGDDTKSSIEIGRRATETPAMRRDTTGLDLADDDVFGNLDDSFTVGDMPRGSRSVETSSVTLSNFKSRSRQSSFVGRNDPPIRPSSRGPNTPGLGSSLNIGLFRRRPREPSILGARRRRSQSGSDLDTAQNLGVGSEADDEGPDAESTPPLRSRRQTRQSLRLQSGGRSSPRAPRGRDSDGVAGGEIPQPVIAIDFLASAVIPDDSDSELSALTSPTSPPAGFAHRAMTPVQHADVTAPPVSSDSEAESDVWPDIHTLARKRRRPSITTPLGAAPPSDLSSPPSLTHSPILASKAGSRRRGRSTARHQTPPKVTTADLTNLLPKRRPKRPRDSFDLDGDDDEFDSSALAHDEEEDELSYHHPTRATTRRRGSRPAHRPASARHAASASSHARVADGPAAKQRRRTPVSAPASALRSSRKNKQTYQRRSSDKENESGDEEADGTGINPLPDDSFEQVDRSENSTADPPQADELRKAAKKFKEVDKWQLDFEEVAEPSSPQNAR